MEDELWINNPDKRRQYYEVSGSREAFPLLLRTLALGKFKTALDLGCGAGVDAREMARQGLEVTGVDINPEVRKYFKETPEVNVVISSFQDFDFGRYDLIFSKSAMVFLPPQDFIDVLGKIKKALNPGGIFSARLWGTNDSSNKPEYRNSRSFTTKKELKDIFKGYEIIELEESERDGETALGQPKHWHLIDIIAQKPTAK